MLALGWLPSRVNSTDYFLFLFWGQARTVNKRGVLKFQEVLDNLQLFSETLL